MTLRRNVLLALGLIGIGLIGSLSYISASIVLAGFAQEESQEIDHEVTRALNSLHTETSALAATSVDWANWDDTYAFVQGTDPQYIESNLAPAGAFLNNRLDVMLFFDLDGRLVFGKALDRTTARVRPVPADLLRQFGPGSPFLLRADARAGTIGLLTLPQGALIASIQPILTSNQEGPARGTLVFGRWLQDADFRRLSNTTGLAITGYTLSDTTLPADVERARTQLTTEHPRLIQPLSDATIAGYLLIPDLVGRPTLIMRVEQPREIYARGVATWRYFVGLFCVIGLTFTVLIWLLMERMILVRLSCLTANVRRIGLSPELAARVDLPGHDELSQLAHTINDTLAALREATQARQEADARFARLAQSASDLIICYELEPEARFSYVSPAAVSISGYTPDELIAEPQLWHTLIYPDDQGHVAAQLAAPDWLTASLTARWVRKDGAVIWTDQRLVGIRDRNGHLLAIEGIIRDTTDRTQQALLAHERNRVLELIARRASLDEIFGVVERMVARQQPGLVLAILLLRSGRIVVGNGARLPIAYRTALVEQPAQMTIGTSNIDGAWRPLAVVGDLPADGDVPDLSDIARQSGLCPIWSLPIRAQAGETLGIVAAYGSRPRGATTAELQLADTACALCAIALEQHTLTDQLAHQASHDALTGLPNRLLFADQLQHALTAAMPTRRPLAVLFVDLDRFKQINDTLGHSAGDIVIAETSRRLTHFVGARGSVARMGGDEFIVLVTDLASDADVDRLAHEVVAALEPPIYVGAHALRVHASIGISCFPQDGQDSISLTHHADLAMVQAKSRGRNTYVRFTPDLTSAAVERVELEVQLRLALERGELSLYYQPQVDRLGQWVGVEALLRWRHPELGFISPARFIPVAEETGLIHPLGQWVLNAACEQLHAWQGTPLAHVRVAINVSAVQFQRPGYVDQVRWALERSGAPPERLELELTESAVLQDFLAAIGTIQDLKSLGVHIAIDDFGTGYASLSYLQQLPIDTIKIDRTFVQDLDGGSVRAANNQAIVGAITQLAHKLGMGVIAEGIETSAQQDFVQQIGCDWMQGFLFSPPVPNPLELLSELAHTRGAL